MKKIKNLLLILTCCTLMLTTTIPYYEHFILPTSHLDSTKEEH